MKCEAHNGTDPCDRKAEYVVSSNGRESQNMCERHALGYVLRMKGSTLALLGKIIKAKVKGKVRG